MKKQTMITIGGVSQDVIIEYLDQTSSSSFDTFFREKEGSKIAVHSLNYALGGCAANAAVSFKRLGFESTALFKIGSDATGIELVKKLTTEGITSHYSTVTPLRSGTSFILPTMHHDRIIFAYAGANEALKETDIPLDLFNDNSHVYIGPLHGQAAELLPHITKKIKARINHKGIRIAVNPGGYQLTTGIRSLEAALTEIDLLITNKEEMGLLMGSLKSRFFKSTQTSYLLHGPSLLTGPLSSETQSNAISFSLHEYCLLIFSYGIKRIIVTNGKEGAYVITPETIYFHPALPVDSPSTTVGAGDAFGSTFFAFLTIGKRIDDAIRAAIINAQSVIHFPDAQFGLLSIEALTQKALSLDPLLIKRFPLD